MSTDPILTKLKTIATCDLSTALTKLSHPNGGFLPNLTLLSPHHQSGTTHIAGPAYPVLYAPLSDPRPKHPTHYIDTVPAGAVLLITAPVNVSNAVYGGLMTARAQARGAVGTVVDARVRDLAEHREMEFPVFAKGVGTAPPGPVLKVVGVGVEVEVSEGEKGGVRVRPGDYLVGDLNGVVVVPKELSEKAIELAEEIAEMDGKVMEAVKGGMGFEEASAKFRS